LHDPGLPPIDGLPGESYIDNGLPFGDGVGRPIGMMTMQEKQRKNQEAQTIAACFRLTKEDAKQIVDGKSIIVKKDDEKLIKRVLGR
jgi:hypothetical protein